MCRVPLGLGDHRGSQSRRAVAGPSLIVLEDLDAPFDPDEDIGFDQPVDRPRDTLTVHLDIAGDPGVVEHGEWGLRRAVHLDDDLLKDGRLRQPETGVQDRAKEFVRNHGEPVFGLRRRGHIMQSFVGVVGKG